VTPALSRLEVRRAALRAQGLLGAVDRRGGVPALLRRLGAVQLDTISVLARSHELVPYARLGPVGRQAVERAYWDDPAVAFEYWSHAACVLPLEEWPLFAFRRREMRGRVWGRPVPLQAREEVLRRLAELGPLGSRDLAERERPREGWWDWAPLKRAVEALLSGGEVVCTRRESWQRVYDLPERAIPAALRAVELDDRACLRGLVERSGRALGVGTRADLADVHRLRVREVEAVVGETSLVPVEVEGWGEPAWAHPEALDGLGAGGRHRTTLLSPFDSLVWDRARTERVFGFAHRLEAYVPAPKRVHGYFAMPLLAGGRLLGRVDPAREGDTLVARRAALAGPRGVEPLAVAMREAATWVGCDALAVQAVDPPELEGAVRTALAAA